MYIQLCDSGDIFNYLAGYLTCINPECTVVLTHKPAYSHCIQCKCWRIYILCFSLLVLSLRLFYTCCLLLYLLLDRWNIITTLYCLHPQSSTYSMQFFLGTLLVTDVLTGNFVSNRMCRVQKTLEILGIYVNSVENENWLIWKCRT